MSRFYSRTDRRHINKQSNHNQSVGVVLPNQLSGLQMSVHDLAAEIAARQMYQEQESLDAGHEELGESNGNHN